MVNNYFKIGKSEIVFFNDSDGTLIRDAFEVAQKISREYPHSRVSVFRSSPVLAEFTRYVVGESPVIAEYAEVAQWTSTGWVTRTRDIGQGREEMVS